MINNVFKDDVEKCLQVLQSGGIILYPTDTVWGIGCDATNNKAVDAIIKLKKRTSGKSFVVLVTQEKDILHYTTSPDLAVFDYLKKTTRPTTVIYDHALGLADDVCNADGSVAIRICKDDFCRNLIKRFGKPIVSTSANISAAATPKNFAAISNHIKKNVDYVVFYRQNEVAEAEPSAIIKWQNGAPQIIR